MIYAIDVQVRLPGNSWVTAMQAKRDRLRRKPIDPESTEFRCTRSVTIASKSQNRIHKPGDGLIVEFLAAYPNQVLLMACYSTAEGATVDRLRGILPTNAQDNFGMNKVHHLYLVVPLSPDTDQYRESKLLFPTGDSDAYHACLPPQAYLTGLLEAAKR